MAMLNHTLEVFLQECRLLVGNSQTVPGVTAALAGYGYTPARLAEGKTLLDRAEGLVLAQRREYGEQLEASAAVQDAWTKADTAYMKTLKVARLVFAENVQAIVALKLAGPRKAALPGWVDQAVSFYSNLLAQSHLAAAMGRFGYTVAKLTAEKALVDQVVTRSQAQAKEMGEAQKATADRDSALDQLDTWVGELRTILKVALADDIQTLEAVGITVAKGGRPKKK